VVTERAALRRAGTDIATLSGDVGAVVDAVTDGPIHMVTSLEVLVRDSMGEPITRIEVGRRDRRLCAGEKSPAG